MASIHTDVFDAALAEITTNSDLLVICSSEPANYAGVAAVALGHKTTPTFTGPATGDTSGRKITVDAVSDGTVTGTGTASHWALVDGTDASEAYNDGTTLYASGSLSSTQSVTDGNTFTLTAFDIEIQDPS